MHMLPIAYLEPLQAAWNKMKDLLFRPFDITRWLVIGFGAWLATLGEQGGSLNIPDIPHHHPEMSSFIRAHWHLIITVGSLTVLLIFILAFVLAWLSARGKFIFLDNCLTGQARITEPWNRWRRQGNSLFVWLLLAGCIVLVICLVLAGLCLLLAWPDICAKTWGGRAIGSIALGGLFLLLLAPVLGYVMIFLEDFVVPLMRRHDLKTCAAWQKFGQLFRAQPGPFLLYGLLRLALGMLVSSVILLAGCLTCCCGFLILAIPYIGTVLLLPILAWQRYWGLEFLRQFGPDYDAWQMESPAQPPPIVAQANTAP